VVHTNMFGKYRGSNPLAQQAKRNRRGLSTPSAVRAAGAVHKGPLHDQGPGAIFVE